MFKEWFILIIQRYVTVKQKNFKNVDMYDRDIWQRRFKFAFNDWYYSEEALFNIFLNCYLGLVLSVMVCILFHYILLKDIFFL